jgi:hypothetical protein
MPASWRATFGPGVVMGIRLVTEVLDRYHGPDARKLWLIAWAEKANDRTRTGWPTRDVLARRTGRSASRVSHISEELVAEGVLKRDGGGNRSGPARFILLPLAVPEKGAPRAHSFDDSQGAAAASAEATGKGAPRTHPSDARKGAESAHPETRKKGAPRTHPKVGVKGAESERKGAESGRKGADPTPQPAETGSLPLIPSQEQPSLIPTGDSSAEPTAQTIVAAFIDWVRESGGELTRRTVGQLAKQIGDLLAQGVPDRFIRKGLADWHASGLPASTLDSFVNAAMNAAARGRAAQNGRGESTGNQRVQQALAAGRRVQDILDRQGGAT